MNFANFLRKNAGGLLIMMVILILAFSGLWFLNLIDSFLQSLSSILGPTFFVISLFVIFNYIRLRDLNIPTHIKNRQFIGLNYQLQRDNYQSFLIDLVSQYDNEFEDHKNVRSFLYYSAITFMLFIGFYIIVCISVVGLFLLSMPYVIGKYDKLLLIVSSAILGFIYYKLFNVLFPSPVFKNVEYTYKNIKKLNVDAEVDIERAQTGFIGLNEESKRNNAEMIFVDQKDVVSEQKKKSKLENFEMLFADSYKSYIGQILSMLTDFEYINGNTWKHKNKYVARMIYEEFVKLGVMNDLGNAMAGRCFESKFEAIKETSFVDIKSDKSKTDIREQQRNKVKTDLNLILSNIKFSTNKK